LVFPLVLDPQLHAPYISSPSHRHLFATHDRTSAAYSAAVPSLSQARINSEGRGRKGNQCETQEMMKAKALATQFFLPHLHGEDNHTAV